MNIESFQLATMERKRAREIFTILCQLEESGRLDFKNARKNGIEYAEWLKAHHLFLSTVSDRREEMREFLF